MENGDADIKQLKAFLVNASLDALARGGDPFDQTPLFGIFVTAELGIIEALTGQLERDEQVRTFVRRWRERVETAAAGEYPNKRGAIFAATDDVTWIVGAQRLRAAITAFDAFVGDETIREYRTLGTVDEDYEQELEERRDECDRNES